MELTLLPNKLKSGPFPKQSQNQSLFQAEHFRPKFSSELLSSVLPFPASLLCYFAYHVTEQVQKPVTAEYLHHLSNLNLAGRHMH